MSVVDVCLSRFSIIKKLALWISIFFQIQEPVQTRKLVVLQDVLYGQFLPTSAFALFCDTFLHNKGTMSCLQAFDQEERSGWHQPRNLFLRCKGRILTFLEQTCFNRVSIKDEECMVSFPHPKHPKHPLPVGSNMKAVFAILSVAVLAAALPQSISQCNTGILNPR